MKFIKQCKYDNMNLDYWDIVIFESSWSCMLWMIKSSYHDGKTDCSWHYIKLQSKWQDIDIQWSEILYKLEWDEVWILKVLIETWEIVEDQNDKRIKVINEISNYEERISCLETDLKMYKWWLKESKDILERLNNGEEVLFDDYE